MSKERMSRNTGFRYKNLVTGALASLLLLFVWHINHLAVPDSIAAPPACISTSTAEQHTKTHEQAIPTTTTTGPAEEEQDGPLIPANMWQIMLSKDRESRSSVIDAESLRDTAPWLAMNPGYVYTLMGDDGGDAFVQKHFSSEPDVVEAYKKMPNVGMKSDLLRYLILGVNGGVYTDTDTVALKPIDKWVPAGIRDQVRLIVGIEFDRRDGDGWIDIPHWVQFCQWTIAAAPGHVVFDKMVSRILHSLDELSTTHDLPIEQVQPTNFEVMNSTGPAAWTDVVFAELQRHEPSLRTTQDLSFMTRPMLFGDILVLPVDGFGMAQPHSHSTDDGTIPQLALVRHLFRGSWRAEGTW